MAGGTTMDDLKKLLLHGIARSNLDEREERPMPIKEEKAAVEEFSQADFPDTISFSIIRERDLTKLFSKGAFNRWLHIIRLFVGGRILGYFHKNNKCPEVAVVHIHMEFITKEEFDKRSKS